MTSMKVSCIYLCQYLKCDCVDRGKFLGLFKRSCKLYYGEDCIFHTLREKPKIMPKTR